MYSEEIKISKDRMPILIGKRGSTKRQIETRTRTKIRIDSKEGDVEILSEEPYNIYTAKLVVTAIARGFNPELAIILTREDIGLEIINMPDIIGKNKNKLVRQKSRIIGTSGRSKKTIEDLTNTTISVHGKTVSIIGHFEDIVLARKAIEKLIQGSKHGNVYRWIEKQESNKGKFIP